MEFVANEGKNVEITVNGVTYMRHAIKTHFVKQGEDYIEIFKKYVQPLYEEGDIVSSSEKIIALCQGRVVKREELKIGFWAKFLSKFASHPDTGVGVGETIKMQYAISKVGTDLLGRYYAEAYGMTVMTTRMFTHTGPRRGDVFHESTFAKQIAMIEAGMIEPKVMVGNLKRVISQSLTCWST